MKTKIETKIITEYPEIYPRTPECEQYLQLRAKHEEAQGKRVAGNLLAALGGTSGLNNAAYNEEFWTVQNAYHDCQMTAMAFFSAKKAITDNNNSINNNNRLTK